MDYDDLFINSFLNDVQEKEKKKIRISQEERIIAAEKKKKLEVIEKFLQKFVDLGVMVYHSDQYTANAKHEIREPLKFSFYHTDTSKKWAPGISIWFDHPATVEIAIPNNQKEDGVVIIKVASTHPYSYIIDQSFNSYESACEALGRFLSKSTHSITQDARKYLKDVEQKKQIHPESRKSTTTAEENEPTLHQNQPPHEAAVLKSGKGTPLKKLGDFFHNSSKDEDEE